MSFDWIVGDLTGLRFPAHPAALRRAGAAFLTEAFRASGTLDAANTVGELLSCAAFAVGGTGCKARLTVRYADPDRAPPANLFVKFSRNFDDPGRDRIRHMMAPEVKFAALSREPGFPIRVPRCLFADFHHESGTGILITESIAFGQGAIERQYAKCLDRDIPHLAEHYQAVVRALARMSGAHKAGHLSPGFDTQFPFERDAAIASDRSRFSAAQLSRRTSRIAEFAARFPQLLPDDLRGPDFLAQFAHEAPRVLAHEEQLRRFLFSDSDFIALGHWNANIDNVWFWRDASGDLQNGLMDWGQVGQMNVAQSLYGALSGADPDFWRDELDALLDLFVAEFSTAGGPNLSVERLKLHLRIVIACMGLAYIVDAPARIEAAMPDLAQADSALDERFRDNEDARVWLHMLTMFLNQWRSQSLGALPEALTA